MGYCSDSIAILCDMGPLSICGAWGALSNTKWGGELHSDPFLVLLCAHVHGPKCSLKILVKIVWVDLASPKELQC